MIPCSYCQGTGQEVSSGWLLYDPSEETASWYVSGFHCADHELRPGNFQYPDRKPAWVEDYKHSCCVCDGEGEVGDDEA